MTELLKSHPTDLEFKDQRQYIHSTTLVEHLLAVIEASFLPASEWENPVVSARFHRLAKTNGHFLFFDSFPVNPAQAPAADFRFELGKKSYSVHFLDDGPGVSKRAPSRLDIRNLRLTGSFAGSAEIGSSDRRTWVESLIEANKQIHLLTLGKAEKRPQVLNLYMKGLPLINPTAGDTCHIVIENVGVRSHADSVATLNRLSLQGHPSRCELSYVLEGISQEQLSL